MHEKAGSESAAQPVPLTAAADFGALSERENMGLHGRSEILPSDLCPLGEAAEGEYLAVIIFRFSGGCFGVSARTYSESVVGTAGADVVCPAQQDHFGIFA